MIQACPDLSSHSEAESGRKTSSEEGKRWKMGSGKENMTMASLVNCLPPGGRRSNQSMNPLHYDENGIILQGRCKIIGNRHCSCC